MVINRIKWWLVVEKWISRGDGCFFIGLGGKHEVPKSSYEPYQCCPTKIKKGSKVAKVTPTSDNKNTQKEKGSSKRDRDTTKSTGKKDTSDSAANGKSRAALSIQEKPTKGKKSLFGNKYLWWW
ncbi:uncharacterized protein [Bemisia tabaci]|uniref:uncharacterized protein isoform X2 n=1 Tax=Bemisia tabaci TaxID=7038 RepID=UPI003B27ECEC